MNPILQMLNAKQNPVNNIAGVLSMLKSGNPNIIYQQMMQNNQQFRDFVQQNQGKAPDQIARENGIDPSILTQLMK